jgi:outer membrane protein OmpA-like peptidoglycan-associated protein
MKHQLLFLFLLTSIAAASQEQFTVYFDFDKDKATAASQDKLLKWIEGHHNAEIKHIYGYADSIGTPDYNIKLSERRANYVAGQLQAKGLAVKNIEIKGFGETTVFSENLASDRIVVIHYNEQEKAPLVVKAADSVAVTPIKTVTVPTQPFTSGLTAAVNAAKKGDRLRLPNMNFYNGMEEMLPESKPVLEELLAIMKDNPKLKITIEGHICCDRLESDKLSYRRAKVVYRYLINGGIAKKRLDYRGYAGTSPIHFIPEKNDEERAANRRVEIHITAK